MAADVVNVSRTGALVRTAHQQRPGVQWPLILELRQTAVTLSARVVRCEAVPVPRRGARRWYTLGLAFVDPTTEVQALIDEVCRTAQATEAHPRRFYISFARRCPQCRSRAVQKETKRRYSCNDCGLLFTGFRIGGVRFAR
jgi:hypothetical protein